MPSQEEHTSFGLCGSAFLGILLDSPQEIVAASRVSHMFDTHMQSFLDVSVTNHLLQRNTDSALRDVEHNASLAVVKFVRQSLLLSRVSHDIDNVSDFVDFELDISHIRRTRYVCAQFDHTLLAELASKQLARTRSVKSDTIRRMDYYLLPKECGMVYW